jgi:hypothetical protein
MGYAYVYRYQGTRSKGKFVAGTSRCFVSHSIKETSCSETVNELYSQSYRSKKIISRNFEKSLKEQRVEITKLNSPKSGGGGEGGSNNGV